MKWFGGDTDRKRMLRALRELTDAECRAIKRKEGDILEGERAQVIEVALHKLGIELTETEREGLLQ